MAAKQQSRSVYEAKNHWTWHPVAMLAGIALMVISVVLLVNPSTTLATIALVLGAVLILRAVVTFFSATKALGAEEKSQATVGYIVGGFLLILGIILVLRPPFIIGGLFYVAAVVFILDTLSNLFLLPKLWQHNGAIAIIAGVANVMVLAAAIMLLIDPSLDWYTQTIGLGVGMFAWGVDYLMFGVAAAGWLPRREPVHELDDAAARELRTAPTAVDRADPQAEIES